VISYDGIETVKEREAELVEAALHHFSEETGRKLSSKSSIDLKEICENIWSTGRSPPNYQTDIANLNIPQARLEVARLHDYMIRKEKGRVAEDDPFFGPLTLLEFQHNSYVELYLRNTKVEEEEDVLTNINWASFKFDSKTAAENLKRQRSKSM
jgi:hypothetical protein